MGRDTSTAQYRELGQELQKRRLAVGWTGGQLAERTGWSVTKISRIETGLREVSMVELMQYLGGLRVHLDEVKDLIKLCGDAGYKLGYWLTPHGQAREETLLSLIYHESTAFTSTNFEPQLVHGLLQTSDYARARMADWLDVAAELERYVQIRRDRQRILYLPGRGWFTFYLHEQALRLQVGSRAIMYQQMLKLNRLATLPNIRLRVVPASAGERSAFGGAFRVFEYKEHRPLVYLDNHASGLFLEDSDHVAPYRALIPTIAAVALDEGQSRELIATLANEYGQGSEPDADYRMEEEQL